MQVTMTREETVKACTCEAYKEAKRRRSSSFRKWVNLYLNKKRRTQSVYSFYYASCTDEV